MQSFSHRVLTWFERHGRQHLPWQIHNTAYTTWVSEIMLQQTQVVTVIPYFNRFIEIFPDVMTLANASQDHVLSQWQGLGYYSRARNLHKAAQQIRDQYGGEFPQLFEQVFALPGIGRSTAGAILALAFDQHYAILDGNVKRVLSRHQMIAGIPNQTATLKKQWQLAEQLTPSERTGAYTQAMMDLGAMICTRSQPRCDACPVFVDCQARLNNCIGDYPNKKVSKTLPQKSIVMVIISDGKRVYLEKRPNSGIWGGLWSLPECNNIEGIPALLDELNVIEQCRQTLTLYTHTFTHYRLQITPIWIKTPELTTGLTQEAWAQRGLPKPVQDILSGIL